MLSAVLEKVNAGRDTNYVEWGLSFRSSLILISFNLDLKAVKLLGFIKNKVQNCTT